MFFQENIKKAAKRNEAFRRVLSTGKKSQLVLMAIPQGEDIGAEVHPSTDQILFIVDGKGNAVVNGKTFKVGENDVVFVPAGARHNLINQGDDELKLFTIYSPAEHADGTVHETKAEALAAEHG
ncbi:MAG TPA: cupin domain-containing protein [Thermoanaerobaculia bacterium]|nr:cupin domain-containing protein [Thermoanaerobaculia bacterium]